MVTSGRLFRHAPVQALSLSGLQGSDNNKGNQPRRPVTESGQKIGLGHVIPNKEEERALVRNIHERDYPTPLIGVIYIYIYGASMGRYPFKCKACGIATAVLARRRAWAVVHCFDPRPHV
eukprot:COSAG05_NODE_9_length_39734_cov_180.598067_8_plen_120_part_00